MRIGLLSSQLHAYCQVRLLHEAEKRGHTIVPLNLATCTLTIDAAEMMLSCDATPVKDLDILIARLEEPQWTPSGATIVRYAEQTGLVTINGADGILQARNKIWSLQLAAQQRLPIPRTLFIPHVLPSEQLMRAMGFEMPLIIKFVEGTSGVGVVLAPTYAVAKSIIEAFAAAHIPCMVQEYIKESEGRDIRCFVIGDEVVASMERVAPPGEFRANYQLGAAVHAVHITAQERALAIRAAQVTGLDVAGVDLLRSLRGPLLLEINGAPGLEGIEHATGQNVAGLIIAYAERKVAYNRGTPSSACYVEVPPAK